MDYISLVLCGSAGLILLWIVLRARQRKGLVIPGPRGLPIVGFAFTVATNTFYRDMDTHADKFGEIMAVDILNRKLIFLNSERIIRKVLLEDGKKYMNDRPPFYIQEDFFPDGKTVFMGRCGFSPVHNLMRKTFAKGLHVYGDGTDIFEGNVKSGIQTLLAEIESFQGEEFEFTKLIRNSLASLISVLLNGKPLSDDDEMVETLWTYTYTFAKLVTVHVDTVMSLMPLARHVPGIYKSTYDDFKESKQRIFDEYFHTHKTSDKKTIRPDVVGVLLAEQQQQQQQQQQQRTDAGSDVELTDARLMGVISDVIVAGILTSFGGITSTILCLMNHPEVCRRTQAEILAVVGKDRLPELSDKVRCPYTEAVSMEVRRSITIVPLGCPDLCNEHTSFEGYDIPADSVVLTNLWYMHHDPQVWGDPWNFRPEKFLDDSGQLLPRTHLFRRSWMPFGIGKRQCSGEEFARSRIFLYVTSLLQKWTFVPPDDKCGSCDPRSDDFCVTITVFPKPFYCRATGDGSL